MGADEAIPFSDRAAAESFAKENGGRAVAFEDVPSEYVLGTTPDATSSVDHGSGDRSQHDSDAPSGPSAGHAH
jgi:copper chaperone NosL